MTIPRILIPTLFNEAWDSVLIATYGADLEFFERVLLRQLNRTRNRVVFCDGRQIARKLAREDSRAQLRQLNRAYVLAPIWTGGAAHAKLIMLLSQDRGLLAVGSGNLGMNGYASQGECFSRYRWSEDDPDQLGEFLVARSFFDQICGHGMVKGVTAIDPLMRGIVTIFRPQRYMYTTRNGSIDLSSNSQLPRVTRKQRDAILFCRSVQEGLFFRREPVKEAAVGP